MSGWRTVAGVRSPQAEARVLGGLVRDPDRAVVRSVLPDPREVVLAEGGAGDDPERVLRQTGDGEVALDAAARVQHLRVRHLADLACDPVGAEALEEIGRALPGDENLRERALVEDRGRLAAGEVLGSDRGRPELPGPTARSQRLVAARGVRFEPVRALPARLLPEHRTELLQPRVRGGDSQRAPRRALVAGVLDVVVRLVDLARARDRVLAAAVGAPEASRVHVPDVERRRPLDDPLGDELSHPARPGQPVRAEARSHPEAAHVGRTEDELAVRRERLGPVDELHDLHLRERRHPHDGVLHQLLEARPVLLEEARVEVGGDPVEPPRCAVPLVPAHHEAARLRPEVDEERGVAHRRHVERQARGLRHEVLVRHRDDRDVHAHELPDLTRVHPAGIDDDLRLDRAAVGLDARDAAALDGDPGDAGTRRRPRRRACGRPPRARR